MNHVLWSAQILLGLAFAMAGIMKSTRPVEELASKMAWVREMSPSTVRFIGISELAGAIGLVAPWATHIVPVLTPIAAAGLVTIMLLAAIFHARRGEWGPIGVNVVLGGLAAFVAWGRFHA